MTETKMREGENESQFIWRLCQAKDSGQLEIDWKGLSNIFNKELRSDETEYRDESAYRKGYQYAKLFYEDVFKEMIEDDLYLNELTERTETFKKERYKLLDERAEHNRRLRNESRLEDRLDKIEASFKESGKKLFSFKPGDINSAVSDNDLLVVLSDLHIGQTFDSFTGKYNSDIAIKRLQQYLENILSIGTRNNSENCYVSIQGDLISNSIHKSLQVSNRENVIEQIKLASEMLSNFVYELSGFFNKVIVTSVSGNHSRLERKEDALKDERLDDLPIWYMKASLHHIKNIEIQDNNIDSTMAIMNIRGKEYINVHGDYDAFTKNGITNLTMMLGRIPYAVTFGHLHTCSFVDESGVKM